MLLRLSPRSMTLQQKFLLKFVQSTLKNMHHFATSLNSCICSSWEKKTTVLCLSSCDRYLWQLSSAVINVLWIYSAMSVLLSLLICGSTERLAFYGHVFSSKTVCIIIMRKPGKRVVLVSCWTLTTVQRRVLTVKSCGIQAHLTGGQAVADYTVKII